MLTHVSISPLAPERFQEVLTDDAFDDFERVIERATSLFEGRVVWNVNSTARGGGVAEMLRSLLAYSRGAAVDARWVVIEGNPDFFRVTKRIHNQLHGAEGDGGALGKEERAIYDEVAEHNVDELLGLVSPQDVVIVHDPQPAGLVARLKETAAVVIWRCHVGLDLPNDIARAAWEFLIPYVEDADAYVFSREDFAWEGLSRDKITVIPPSIDAFSPKNQHMGDTTMRAILKASGLCDDEADGAASFVRHDGTPGRVDRKVTFEDGNPPPPAKARWVVQVSRWDRLKDPVGVLTGFADHIAPADREAHLVLAGPDVRSVADDPEGAEVLEESRAAWEGYPDDVRSRIHLACLPMEDGEENAAIVNALQRRADVAVQKSIAEGFGLTVAEAMWKARPVVASRIGGIQDQIVDGTTGVLVDDPRDLAAYGEAVSGLLADEQRRQTIGLEAQKRVQREYLGPRHLTQYVELIDRFID